MDETDTTTRHWHTGRNMPGYLPEGDIGTHATFAEARSCLAEDLEYMADDLDEVDTTHDCLHSEDDEPTCHTFDDNCADLMAEDCRNLADDLLNETQDETVWQGYAGDLSWWICECCEPACMAEIDD